jgi:hypothetical protein
MRPPQLTPALSPGIIYVVEVDTHYPEDLPMIDAKFIAYRNGKPFPLYAGVLDAATRTGLMGLTTTLIQIPSPENMMVAIVSARAVFEDGRVFEDVGDASPLNCAEQLVSALIRMASTRAKGRCLRDSVNVGQTMFEELPDDAEALKYRLSEEGPEGNGHQSVDTPTDFSEAHPINSNDASSLEHRRSNGNAGLLECSTPGCEKPLTKGQHDISQRKYGEPLCPTCQRQKARA